MKEDLYTAYYAVSEDEEIVGNKEIEIPRMEEQVDVVEKIVAVELNTNVTRMNIANSQNGMNGQKEQTEGVKEQQIALDEARMLAVHSVPDANEEGTDERIADETGKSECAEAKEIEPVDKTGWIVKRISELGGYKNVVDSVKAEIFGFDIVDVSESIRVFKDVMERLEIKLGGKELYEEFQKIYDESVSRETDIEKAEDKMWNSGRRR